ncbi:hypothetical protein BJX66DRAFT_320741 [Aspergillus keveii]|uniref:Ribonuclease H1 N-terminal domain-containing protein n=1 Tax=Aspergillus keveii TaxID=714993 RepID=A0ABR4FGQ3_9EURO
MARNKRNQVYVVYVGHVTKPTIFFSWAEAHPRVIEYNGADHENFPNLDEALKSMAQRNISDFDVTPECTRAWDSVPQSKKGLSYYAVAYGKTTGVFETWEETKKAVNGFSSACFQKFDTECEAQKFIEIWQDTYIKVCMAVIAKKLRHGWLPCDLAFNTSSLVISPGILNSETELAADLARMGLGDYGGNK